jgi:hypothetical protein
MKNGTVSPDFECAEFIVHKDVVEKLSVGVLKNVISRV